MSGHIACTCAGKNRRANWVVIQRNCNHSAFNGYHQTFSDYSHVICLSPGCTGSFRTKANYVLDLPDAELKNGEWMRKD